jgi:hypothetical protein
MTDDQLKGQLEGKKGIYTVQVYEVAEGELSIGVYYKDPSKTRGYAAHFYTDFKRCEPNPNGNFDGNYGGE